MKILKYAVVTSGGDIEELGRQMNKFLVNNPNADILAEHPFGSPWGQHVLIKYEEEMDL